MCWSLVPPQAIFVRPSWRRGAPAATLGCLLLLAGCAGGMSRQDAASYDSDLAQGNYPAAAQQALSSGHIASDGKSDNLIWSLNAGAALVYADQPPYAIRVLDGAESLMKTRDLSNFGNTQYDYATYDGIMVNVYKGLEFLKGGDKADARVEFNRVADRQTRAEDDFAKQKRKLDAQARKRAGGSFDLDAAMKSAQQTAAWRDTQAELGKYANYRPFINPAASYIRAIFLLNDGMGASDREAARVELERVRDMAGPSPAVRADLASLRSARRGPPETWVIFENGQAPTFVQYNLTFPVPIIGRGGHLGISVVTVAMPRMVFHAPAAERIAVVGTGAPVWTASIGDFDHVMASEFSRRQPAIMTRTLIEAVLKAGLQSVAAQTGNAFIQVAALVASNISTADTRSWIALPKEFQAARVPAPRDGVLHLRTASGLDLGEIHVPQHGGAIVYVKQVAAGVKPSIQVVPL